MPIEVRSVGKLIGCASISIHENDGQPEMYKAFPNPFKQELTIALKAAKETEFKLYTTLGALVRRGKLNARTNTIDLSALPPNVYLLRIEDYTVRLIKTR